MDELACASSTSLLKRTQKSHQRVPRPLDPFPKSVEVDSLQVSGRSDLVRRLLRYEAEVALAEGKGRFHLEPPLHAANIAEDLPAGHGCVAITVEAGVGDVPVQHVQRVV